jgi:hypothetical protein
MQPLRRHAAVTAQPRRGRAAGMARSRRGHCAVKHSYGEFSGRGTVAGSRGSVTIPRTADQTMIYQKSGPSATRRCLAGC